MSILIKNISHDNQVCDIYIENRHFAKIAPQLDYHADTVIDGSGHAILPGFYNTHTHAAMSILRGFGDNKPLFEWLSEDIWPIENQLTPDDIYIASKLAILEMIKSGTVFFSDMYFFPEMTIRAIDEMGIRAAVSIVEMDMFDPTRTKEKQQATLDFLNQPNPCPDRLTKAISCHAVYTVSEELFKWTADLVHERDLYLHIHACETLKEVCDCRDKYQKSPIVKFAEWNLLGPKTILAHAIHLDTQDIKLIKDSGTYLTTNPVSNLKLVSGLFPFQQLNGEFPHHITLGTDGASSNNNLSMLEEMKIFSLVSKWQAQNALAGLDKDIFTAATRNGAQAFGLNAGIIEEGALADCILVDLNNPFITPSYNLLSNMVYAADSSCIRDVICNGKLIMQNRKVPGEEQIIADAHRLAERIKNIKPIPNAVP